MTLQLACNVACARRAKAGKGGDAENHPHPDHSGINKKVNCLCEGEKKKPSVRSANVGNRLGCVIREPSDPTMTRNSSVVCIGGGGASTVSASNLAADAIAFAKPTLLRPLHC